MLIKYHLSIAILAIAFLMSSAAMAFSVREEIKLGNEAAKEVEKQMPLSTNQQWQKDIDALGKRFIPFINRKDIPYTFKVVDAKDELNAFALPGGHVYFTQRMWKMMTPDERAAIMAHEITHCDKRHGIDQMLKSQQRMLWMLPLIILSGGQAGQFILWGDMAISQRYSRDDEREADTLGMKLLFKAGFNVGGAVTSMKKLLRMENTWNHYEVSTIFASHPDTLNRVQYMTSAAMLLGIKPEDLELKSDDDPSRLGNIILNRPDQNVVSARVNVALTHGQHVIVKKMLWDDDAQALKPITICKAT
ncbi:MAG: M48 family metalloprotease, partial [Armatimonadetes bacterium]|nr:M48 family metalloprotease [Armatimonadota bacterium]